MPLRFEITHRCSSTRARVGRIETLHGAFDTPAFMPVGTRGTIKGLTPDQIHATGSQIILNNAYHLMLRPGDDLIARRGGVQRFMRWDGPILTDSGGYQAFSMSDINSIDEDGVTFKSIVDGSAIHLSPERSIEVQNNLGADIIMAFDDCPPSVDPATFNESRKRLAAQRAGRIERVTTISNV
jgi:queuine tRNA-ribosyltransferase